MIKHANPRIINQGGKGQKSNAETRLKQEEETGSIEREPPKIPTDAQRQEGEFWEKKEKT